MSNDYFDELCNGLLRTIHFPTGKQASIFHVAGLFAIIYIFFFCLFLPIIDPMQNRFGIKWWSKFSWFYFLGFSLVFFYVKWFYFVFYKADYEKCVDDPIHKKMKFFFCVIGWGCLVEIFTKECSVEIVYSTITSFVIVWIIKKINNYILIK